MKRRFSKILGVGLTLALLTSLLLTASPVSALSSATVTVDPTTISAANAEYAIRFELDEQITGGGSSVTPGDGAYVLREIGDTFVITADAASDVATITEAASTAVTVALSGGATLTSYTGGPTGGVHTIAFNAIDATATVTGLTFAGGPPTYCDGTWASPTGAPTAALTVGDTVADTITIVFDTDTAVADTPVATITAGPGWINGIWTDAITSAITPVGTADTSTVVITLNVGDRIGEGAEVRLAFTAGITNPDAAGDYTLTVETSKEDAVTSADYEITVPDIGVLPGIVLQYNAADILMAQDTGNDAINTMVDSAGVDYTIVVGPGEYEIDETIVIDQAGLTLESSGDTEDTILVAAAAQDAIEITVADVTVDGFTIQDTEDTYAAIMVTGDDAIVQNNIFTAEDGWPEGIHIDGTGATVSGNEFDINNTMLVHGDDATLSDNIFGAGINLQSPAPPLTGITITDNTIIGSELWGIILEATGTPAFEDILIEGNTISETTEGDAIGIFINGAITNLRILDNEITDNEGVGILVDSSADTTTTDSAIAIKFNTITGNDADNDGYGIQNDADTDTDVVDATLNWWGTSVADDVAAMINDTTTAGSVTIYEPFLADTGDAVFSASDVAVGADSLDAKDEVGVRVEDATGANVIVASKYIANPQAAIDDAIAFYDVYVAGADTDVTPTIKFYAGDANSTLHVWSADTEAWADLSEEESFGFSVYGGYVYVDYDAELLGGTPFALVAGAVAEPGIPKIVTPTTGDDTVSLTPIFAWEAVPDVAGYYFEFADNANFVLPLVSLTGDLGRLIVTAYAYVEELPYSTPYYWRVKAVSGTVEAGDLAESAWASGVFITMDEPVEPTPPIVVEEVQPPVIVIEQPDIIVPLPAETAITPAWIYVIIGVGAVLVIALLVLIVRTRRVA